MLVAATTGYQTRAFDQAARRLGIQMLLATDRCHILEDPWGDRALPVRFAKPLESQFDHLTADGILAVGDRPARIAALIAERLNLPFHPPTAVETASDKHLARERFAAAGLISPEHYRFKVEVAQAVSPAGAYPCVLKPLGLSGSRGVIRANNDAEFAAAAERIRTILDSPDIRQLGESRDRWIQVERFVPGPEFALEGLVTGGRLATLAIFDKPDPLDGPFFEETIYVTPSRQPASIQAELKDAAQRAVTALGLSYGPVHAEMRLAAEGVFVLEVAARPIGGLCSRALRFPSGATLEELLVQHALGVRFAIEEALPSGVMMIPIPKQGVFHSTAGLEAARAVPGISDIVITAKTGQKLEMLPEGSSYLGFIFADGPEAETALRQAHRKLSFVIQTALSTVR